jgi:hypothetical protein
MNENETHDCQCAVDAPAVKADLLADLQKVIDVLKAQPSMRQYVEQRKLHLLDDRLKAADALLEQGLLK